MLMEAVKIYREAFEERIREHVPLDWPMTTSKPSRQGAFDFGRGRIGEKTYLEDALEAGRKASKIPLDEAGHRHWEAELKGAYR